MKKTVRTPDPRSAKVMGFFFVLEAVVVAVILIGRFVFEWF